MAGALGGCGLVHEDLRLLPRCCSSNRAHPSINKTAVCALRIQPWAQPPAILHLPCPVHVQVDGEAVAYQLQVDLNCSHAAPLPHSDLATFVANVTLGATSEEVVRGKECIGVSTGAAESMYVQVQPVWLTRQGGLRPCRAR